MRVKQVPSRLFQIEGRRLDCMPYMSGAFEARLLFERLPYRTDRLQTLTKGGIDGIVNAGRVGRRWVDDPQFGIRFLSSSDILQADLTSVPYISRKIVGANPQLLIHEGWTLITRSGTIGRMVYARADMDGMACSEHVMRVIPDSDRIPPGYLYAFLSSKFGVPLVVSGTYGSIIQSIEPHHIADLPVPRLGEEAEREIHELVQRAAELRSQAMHALSSVQATLPSQLGLPTLRATSVETFGTVSVNSANLQRRLDAPYHSLAAMGVERALDSGSYEVEYITHVVKRYFKPPIFKRLWVESREYGPQFVSGNTAYHLSPTDARFVSQKTPGIRDFILQNGWVIFQAAGQIYGLFGQPLYVHGRLENTFCADDMYRLVPYSAEDGAYIFAFLRSAYGQVLLKRQACGNSIPRIWDPHMERVRIPWPDTDLRQRIAKPIIDAHIGLSTASGMEAEAIALVEAQIEGAV